MQIIFGILLPTLDIYSDINLSLAFITGRYTNSSRLSETAKTNIFTIKNLLTTLNHS